MRRIQHTVDITKDLQMKTELFQIQNWKKCSETEGRIILIGKTALQESLSVL